MFGESGKVGIPRSGDARSRYLVGSLADNILNTSLNQPVLYQYEQQWRNGSDKCDVLEIAIECLRTYLKATYRLVDWEN
jgi:hypothetical protein